MSQEKMNSYERSMRALKLQEPDRVPVTSLVCNLAGKWINARQADFCRNGELLGKGYALAHEKFNFDFIDASPDVGWLPEGFGCKISYVEDPPDTIPFISEQVVKEAEDWEKLEVFDPKQKGLRTHEVAVKNMQYMHDKLGNNVMYAIESFSTLTSATHVRKMDDTLIDMITAPDLLHKGLKTITEQWIETAKTSIESGANSILIICTRATRDIVTMKQYLEFGWPYEETFLNELARLYPDVPALMHVCGNEPYFELLMTHPVLGINFWDRGPAISGVSDAPLDLRTAKKKFGKKVCLIGGIDQNRTAVIGDEIDIMGEAREAIISAAHGGGFFLSGGCDLPITMSEESVMALSKSAEKWGRYPLKF